MFHKLAALALALTLTLPGLSFAATPVNVNKAAHASGLVHNAIMP